MAVAFLPYCTISDKILWGYFLTENEMISLSVAIDSTVPSVNAGHNPSVLSGQVVIYTYRCVERVALFTGNYPRALHCGGDIVTLPWFRASRLILVNTIATKLLFTSSSNLADMFTMTRG